VSGPIKTKGGMSIMSRFSKVFVLAVILSFVMHAGVFAQLFIPGAYHTPMAYPLSPQGYTHVVNMNQPGATPNNPALAPKVGGAAAKGWSFIKTGAGKIFSTVNGWFPKPQPVVPGGSTPAPAPKGLGDVSIKPVSASSGSTASASASSSVSSSASQASAVRTTGSTSRPVQLSLFDAKGNPTPQALGQGEAMKALGITKDVRGVYHIKGQRGAISATKAQQMINQYMAKNTPTTSSSGSAATALKDVTAARTVSAGEAMKALGITKDARGVYHIKGQRGAISATKAQQMINQYMAKNASAARTTTASAAKATTTTAQNSSPAFKDIRVIKNADGSFALEGRTANGKVYVKNYSAKELLGKDVKIVKNNDGTVRILDKGTPSQGQVPGQPNQGSGTPKPSKPGLLTKLKAKFANFGQNAKAGFAVGKANAKMVVGKTLNPFSKGTWGNVALMAGMVVGYSVISDLVAGRPVDFGKAIKTVVSREFAGAYIGGSLGVAGGCIAQGVLSAVPVVGPIIGAFMPALGGILGSYMGANLAGQTRQGKFDIMAALKSIDYGMVAGQAVGSTIGAIIGSAICPGIGTVIGGMVGAFVGGKAVNFIRGLFGKGKGRVTPFQPVRSRTGGAGQGTVGGGSTVSRMDARQAYQQYIAAYNKLTNLMSQGKGDTPEAQLAYREYKAAKERYERLSAALK